MTNFGHFLPFFMKPLFLQWFQHRKGPHQIFGAQFLHTIAQTEKLIFGIYVAFFRSSRVLGLFLDRETQTNTNQNERKNKKMNKKTRPQNKQRVYCVSFENKTTQKTFQLQETRTQKHNRHKILHKENWEKDVLNQCYTKKQNCMETHVFCSQAETETTNTTQRTRTKKRN